MECAACGYDEGDELFNQLFGMFLIEKPLVYYGTVITNEFIKQECQLWACPKCGTIKLYKV